MQHLSVTSPDNPRIKQALHLRKPRERRATGLLIAEGWREVERASAAGLKFHHVFFCAPLLKMEAAAVAQRLPRLGQAPLLELPQSLLRKIAYHDEPEGVIAVVEQPTWDMDRVGSSSNALWLIANGINKPGNLGAMARTAAAANATGMIAADADVDPFNPNAIRASTAAVFQLPMFCLSSARAIEWLGARAIRIAAATLQDATPYTQADLSGPLAIAIGREETGLSDPWLSAADLRLTIPMHSSLVDSLNASNAAAILLFEALRQRS